MGLRIIRDEREARVLESLGITTTAEDELEIRAAEATYPAWLDIRALGVDDPGGRALHTGRGGSTEDYGAGSSGHVRVNLATSTDRVREIVDRLARAWSA